MLFGTMIDLPPAENGPRRPAQSNGTVRSPRSRGRVVIGWTCFVVALAAVLLL
jgi:hypothetical protein